MRKLLLFIFTVNIIFAAFLLYQNIIYKNLLVPKLTWAVQTLYLDFWAQRKLYLECENKKKVPM